MDHSKQHYYEAVSSPLGDTWLFKVYHYDPTGNKEIIIHRSDWDYDDRESAEDAAVTWCEEHDIDAKLSGE